MRVLLGFLLLVSCCSLAFEAAASRAGLATVQGTVEVQAGGAWKKGAVGDLLAVGQKVRTGPKSIAVVLLDDMTSLRLGPQSELVIVNINDESAQASLSSGRAWVKATPSGAPTTFELKGPNAVAAVKGTAFEMVVGGGQTKVRVWEGKVAVGQRSLEPGQEWEAAAGGGKLLALDLNTPDAFQRWNQSCDNAMQVALADPPSKEDEAPLAGSTVRPPMPAITRARRARAVHVLPLNAARLKALGQRLPKYP